MSPIIGQTYLQQLRICAQLQSIVSLASQIHQQC